MSTDILQIEGGRHCGAIRYAEVVDPDAVAICHCTDGQLFTGTALRVSLAAAAEPLRIEGEPSVYEKRAGSGRVRRQSFCGRCGSPLFTRGAEPSAPWGIRWGRCGSGPGSRRGARSGGGSPPTGSAPSPTSRLSFGNRSG